MNYFKAFRQTPGLRSIAMAGPDLQLRLHSDALDGKGDWQGHTLGDGAAQRALAQFDPVRDESPDGGAVRWTMALQALGKPYLTTLIR